MNNVYTRLLEAIKEEPAAIDALAEALDVISVNYDRYLNIRAKETVADIFETQDEKADTTEIYHNIRDAYITMNHLAETHNTEPIYTGNLNDKTEVLQFCHKIELEIFKNRKL